MGSGGKARVSESKTKISKLESGTRIKGNEMLLPKCNNLCIEFPILFHYLKIITFAYWDDINIKGE